MSVIHASISPRIQFRCLETNHDPIFGGEMYYSRIMKITLSLCVLLGISAVSLPAIAQKTHADVKSTVPDPNSKLAKGVAIDLVVHQVQIALANVQGDLKRLKVPPLESVVLTLETQYDAKGGPKFTFLVFSFGATWERQKSNQIVLTLKPPKPGALVQMGRSPGLSGELEDALTSAAEGVQNARTGTPPLELDSLKAEIQFVVSTDVTGEAKFEIIPVGVDLKGDLSKKAIHKIDVTYAATKQPDSVPSGAK